MAVEVAIMTKHDQVQQSIDQMLARIYDQVDETYDWVKTKYVAE